MKKTGKKRVSRRKPAVRRGGNAFAHAAWKIGLFLCGLSIGVGLPWLIWLDVRVTGEFEGRKWDLPSRVYARPLSLFPGRSISVEALARELEAANYRPQTGALHAGSFERSGGRFLIHRRGFGFEDAQESATRYEVTLSGGTVAALRRLDTGEALNLVRLDPAEIASIYPLDEEDRTLVSLAEVPPLLVTGLQAVEDRKFKHHPGVDIQGMGRALIANLKARRAVQGGSTLTQQLVKNYFLSSERTLARKLNEAAMSLLLEWHYDKPEILEAYLNEIYLGQQGSHGIHGFARASEFYFSTPLEQLEPHQVALLVGLVRGASFYNPRRNPERALERRNRVLDIFAETGLLGSDEAAQWQRKPLDVTTQPGSQRSRFPAFVDLVRRQLRQDYREEDLRNAGLRIFTTLAPSDQVEAEAAVVRGLEALAAAGLPPELQAALVLADVGSGEVRALVGDAKPGRVGFNRAVDARRQVGSVIKPLVYLVALEHDESYNLLTLLDDEPVNLRQPNGDVWSPGNYDGKSRGQVRLVDALADSLNQATVRLGMRLGVQHVVNKLAQLGVEVDVEPVPATLLGAVELTPLEVTQVFQSIAAGGFSVPLRAVTSVQTADGATLQRFPLRMLPLERRDAVAVLHYGLTQVVERGTARNLGRMLGKPARVAGKTGTTNERRDSWFVGYTRNRLAVSWVGRDDNAPAGVTGSNAAMRLWAELFSRLEIEPVSLDMPEGAYWTWVEPDLNARSDEACVGAVQLPFVAGSEPASESPCLARIERAERKPFWRKWFDR